MNSLRLLGIYRVEVPRVAYAAAFACRGDMVLAREELDSLVLMEFAVQGADASFDIRLFGQEDSDQAPYDEVYFSENGDKIAGAFERSPIPDFKLCFYLHYFDPTSKICTPVGPITPLPITDMPSKLKQHFSYQFYN